MATDGSRISINQREGTLSLTGEINHPTAIELESQLKLLANYYQHSSITLKINSGGGQISALQYIIDALDQMRSQGVQIKTEASFNAMSAAAVLVAVGDVGERVVKRQTHLLFHHPRVNGAAHEFTAGNAGMLAAALKKTSVQIVSMMTTHLIHGFGDVTTFAKEGLLRCDILRSDHTLIAQQLNIASQRSTPKWLSDAERTWQKCLDSDSYKTFAELLTRRHDDEDAMDLREAFALCLIDRVELVPAMQANAARLTHFPRAA